MTRVPSEACQANGKETLLLGIGLQMFTWEYRLARSTCLGTRPSERRRGGGRAGGRGEAAAAK